MTLQGRSLEIKLRQIWCDLGDPPRYTRGLCDVVVTGGLIITIACQIHKPKGGNYLSLTLFFFQSIVLTKITFFLQ